MVDPYERLRNLPLLDVLLALGWDVQSFKVRQQGTEFLGRCPIHDGKKNSTAFSCHIDGRYKCFSCSAQGRGAIDLTMAVKQCGFQEAVTFLEAVPATAEPRIAPRTPARLSEQPAPSENAPFKSTYDKYAVPSSWLKERGFTEDALKRYEVFQYENPASQSASRCVMLKIRRYSDGECVGYLVRNIGEVTAENPKYLFPTGVRKSLELFGAWQIKNDASKRLPTLHVVESPLCVLKFWQLGYAAVSPFGWSVSPTQAACLARLTRECVYLPDRNKMQEAASVVGLLSLFVWVKMPQMPEGVDDPEHLSAEQIRSLTGTS